MPTVPRPRCAKPRCHAPTVPGSSLCVDHAPDPAPSRAPSRADLHMYKSSAWQTIRQGQLSREPLCAGCRVQGLIRAASVVDHVIPWRSVGPEAFRTNRFQSLCPDCHSGKTGLEVRGVCRQFGVRDWRIDDWPRFDAPLPPDPRPSSPTPCPMPPPLPHF